MDLANQIDIDPRWAQNNLACCFFSKFGLCCYFWFQCLGGMRFGFYCVFAHACPGASSVYSFQTPRGSWSEFPWWWGCWNVSAEQGQWAAAWVSSLNGLCRTLWFLPIHRNQSGCGGPCLCSSHMDIICVRLGPPSVPPKLWAQPVESELCLLVRGLPPNLWKFFDLERWHHWVRPTWVVKGEQISPGICMWATLETGSVFVAVSLLLENCGVVPSLCPRWSEHREWRS